jgi:hypothetical protein
MGTVLLSRRRLKHDVWSQRQYQLAEFGTSRPTPAARAVSLSALTGDGSQMIIASSSISAIPITSTAIATGS